MSMLHTYRSRYEQLASAGDGGDITAEGTLLDGITNGYRFDFSDMPAGKIELPEEANGVVIRVEGADVCEDATFGFKVWGYPNQEGQAELIADVCAAFGLSCVGDNTLNLNADTMTVNTDGHYKAVSANDAGGDNRISKLSFDTGGYRWLAVEWVDITDSGEALDGTGSVSAYIRWY